MHINDNLNGINGFTIDPSKIDYTRSTDKRNIELPYTGELPAQFEGVTNPRIYFNVQATEKVRIILLAERDGKTIRARVDAPPAEIEEILMKFFFRFKGNTGKTRFDCGLTPYWLGAWMAHFVEWQRVKDYFGVYGLFDRLDASEQTKFLNLLRANAAAAE